LVRVVAAAAVLATAVAGCSDADELLGINRSGRPIAFAPGLTVGPCEQVPLEREVLGLLLAGEGPTMAALGEQLGRARVASRQFTGAGFYTTFVVPAEVPRIDMSEVDHRIGDVAADLARLDHGAGFLLLLRDGALDLLEGFSYGEPWPEAVDEFRAYHAPITRAGSEAAGR
jgi:hypothetical protein